MGPKADPLIDARGDQARVVLLRGLPLAEAVLRHDGRAQQGFIVFVMFVWPFIDAWLRTTRSSTRRSACGSAWSARSPSSDSRCGKRSSRTETRGSDGHDTRIRNAWRHRRALGCLFLLSLVSCSGWRCTREQQESGARASRTSPIPAASRQCVDCHRSRRASSTTGRAARTPKRASAASSATRPRRSDADAFDHYGAADRHGRHAARLRPLPPDEAAEFAASHHAKAGNILASLDNFLAETVEGSRAPFNPHSPTPGTGRAGRSTAWPAPTPAASSATAARWPCRRPTAA